MEGNKNHSASYEEDDVDYSIFNAINNVNEPVDQNEMHDDVINCPRYEITKDEHQNGDATKAKKPSAEDHSASYEEEDVDYSIFNAINNVTEPVDEITMTSQKVDRPSDDVIMVKQPSNEVITVQSPSADVIKVKKTKLKVDVINFNLLINGIEKNGYIDSKQKPSWVNHFKQAKEDSKWTDNALKCFVYKAKEGFMNLTFKDVYSLVCEYGWLSDSVITAVINNVVKEGELGFIEVSILEALENPHLTGTTPTPFKEKSGYIAVKNVDGNHWIFVYMSLNNQTMYVLDPMNKGVPACSEQLLEDFKTNHHNEKNSWQQPTKWNFKSGDWKIKTIYHSPQKDTYNCGVLCLEYALQIHSIFPIIPEEVVVENEPKVSRKLFMNLLLTSTGLYVKEESSDSKSYSIPKLVYESYSDSDCADSDSYSEKSE